MTTQPEQILENNLISQLVTLGYEKVRITDEAELLANLKRQLEKHNRTTFSEGEFAKVLNHLSRGNVFERAGILRDRMHLRRDDGTDSYVRFLNTDQWCQNEYQVTQQISMEGSYKNRYDVTLLVNGLPLAQIELKRRGLELKEAFNQINRYQRHSYWASHGLFNFIQLFVITNGVNTKYYANNRHQSFKQTFFWADEQNRNITQLDAFAKVFLERCHLSKMICKYTVLAEADKTLMVLRPYQFYAVEAMIRQVKESSLNGYIWHTTGSGKTLTSFKAAQILRELPQVHKVVFVVDRKDLDYQTAKEFNSFSKGSIDGTDDTRKLVRQFEDDTPLIVTTIQKLNTAISKERYLGRMEAHRDKKIVFIFDECHRSQFGDTHKRITGFFQSAQLFGFTGTPIFADNAARNEHGKRTTKDLFDECLHRYVITDAIKDENVLKFSVEYVGRYRYKEGGQNEVDIEVEDIDRQELIESPRRLEKIVDYILAHHDRKTHSRAFTAMFCVSSVEALTRYYDLFRAKREAGEHNLRIATIFTYGTNEEDADANGFIPEESFTPPPNPHTREKLESFIGDYNALYGTDFSTKTTESFYNYYQDIAKRVKGRQVDILLVVNMFLTGFDSKALNTLYVDKNLRYHGLIQAFSRTNRILNEQKSQGNIVCFRNLKKATDEAIKLFSNIEAKEVILMEPYEAYLDQFAAAFAKLLDIAPTAKSVDALEDEEAELEFIKAFRELLRVKNILTTFADFEAEDLPASEQVLEDYKSKYLDLYDKVKSANAKEKVSILDDVDFELELIHRDEINVAYILQLLSELKNADETERKRQRKNITDLLTGESHLRSKRELIERFIDENMVRVESADQVGEVFEAYWSEEQTKAFEAIHKEEGLDPTGLQKVIDNYLFTERKPLRDEVVEIMAQKPRLLERKAVAEKAIDKILNYVETFIDGMGF